MHERALMGYASRINSILITLTALLTFYVILNQMVYLYVVAFTVLGQIIYTVHRPFGLETKHETQQETTAQLHNKIDGLNGTIKAQRGMIEVLIDVNSKLRENAEKRSAIH